MSDKSYNSDAIRAYAHRHNGRITIPHKRNEPRAKPFDRTACRLRNRFDRLTGRWKQLRGLATRYEKRAANDRAMWVIAAITLWLKFSDRP